MESRAVSESNSWLVFADDLNWSKTESEKEVKLLRSMICQQLLFVETLIIPDSWWLSNFQLRRVIEGTDLEGAVREKYLIPARSDKFADAGLVGRFEEQLFLPHDRRMANSILDTPHKNFLKKIDQSEAFVVYNRDLMGLFFSNLVMFISQSPEGLEPFGLSHVQRAIWTLVVGKRKAGENLTASDLYNLFKNDKMLQDRAMAMARPIYAINAPTRYGYHMVLAGDEKDRLYQSVLSLLAGLSSVVAPKQLLSKDKVLDTTVPLCIDDPVFREAGMLTFDEIAGARATHFGAFKKSFVSYCHNEIGKYTLEDAYKAYQSNLRDYLTKRNAHFDVFITRDFKKIASLLEYGSITAGYIVATYAAAKSGFPAGWSVAIGASVAVLTHFVQRALEKIAGTQEEKTMTKGRTTLLTRLDVWMGNSRALKDGRIM